MQLNRKTMLFSVTLISVTVVVLTLVSLISFRQFSIISAQEHARTAAEIVRVGLTEEMINGVIGKRENFLSRLGEIDGLQSAHVVRGAAVIAQFGQGLSREQPSDAIETEVLRTGEPYFGIMEEGMHPIFRSTIPFTASSRGNPNCLQCHHVEEGTVLGAITLTLTIPHLKENALLTVAALVLTVGFSGGLTMLAFRRMTRPLVTTAEDVQRAVESALQGNFTRKVQRRTDDEIGQIADEFNQLSDFLQQGLGGIQQKVNQLIQAPPDKGSTNLLVSTSHMVEQLVEVANFKQAIEEDETRHEVYARLARVIQGEFAVGHFSFYEVDGAKNRVIPVVVDGEACEECRWCDPQILIRSESCRARRTGHPIDSVETPQICTAFNPGPDGTDRVHVCIPVIQSGSVGSVVQLVSERNDSARLREAMPFIQVYLREAAPVLEAKRLMDTLRESTLRDAMTGLHNRRFLEEYVDTLIAGSNRRESHLSILMLDLDYFKKVNDSYGHDAGDTVLKTLAKVLTQNVRSSDLVIRYGGEEFMVILQDSGGDQGDMVAEKIRRAVESTKISITGGVLQKTISIGVADFPRDSDTFWQAIKYADVALYKAKETGRNRVIHFAPEMWQGGEEY